MKKLFLSFLCMGMILGLSAQSLPTKVISASPAGTGTTTWSKDTVYILDGFIFVNSGDVLTIEAGTVIKGESGQGESASALVCARGGQIIAAGTAAEPIIMTGESDDVTDPTDIFPQTRNLWGGLIVLGAAPLNTVPNEQAIEGIPPTETRGIYGGTNAADNSGVYQYISIRHGGTDIGDGNEINGFTLGGVGTGTVVDHVEVFSNKDDGVEWFGGTVNTKYLAVGFVGDDSYDYDQGFRGKGQFWFTIQANDSDRCGEHDGGTSPETGRPYATPNIFNATYIGAGESANKRTVTFRDNAGGWYRNSIFAEQGRGIDIEILGDGGTHSYDRFQDDSLQIQNSIFSNVAGGNNPLAVSPDKYGTTQNPPVNTPADSTAEVDAAKAAFAASFAAQNNVSANAQFGSINYQPFAGSNGLVGLDPRPAAPEATQDLFTIPNDGFYEQVSFKGAFDPAENTTWLSGWSALDHYGYLAQNLGTTGISYDLGEIANIKVYPNPSNGRFSIEAEDLQAGAVIVRVYNPTGLRIQEFEVNPVAGAMNSEIDIENLSDGIYNVMIEQNNHRATYRVVKQ